MNGIYLPSGTIVCAGKFEIKEPIGWGSSGITYRALAKRKGCDVALKECVPSDQCWRDGVRLCVKDSEKEFYDWLKKSMMEEAKAPGRMPKHTGIVTVHDIFIDPGTESLFIEMELLTGGSLKTRMERGRISQEDAENWLKSLLDALCEVHKAEITHRDIKPANIVFNSRNQPVLVDFGAALIQNAKDGWEANGPRTPGYAAPEQEVRIGPWTDLYSLAVTWFQVLTGKAYNDKNKNLHLLDNTENKALADSVRKNLAEKSEERCQRADEWLDMLKRPVAPAIPEVSVDDIRKCINAVRHCYPKDKNGELPLPLELLVRLAECMHLEEPYEKLRRLQQVHDYAFGKCNMRMDAIGDALSWDKKMMDDVESFFLLPAEPIVVHGASHAALNLVRKYFWKSWDIKQTLCGISSLVREMNRKFWESNKEKIYAKYAKPAKSPQDVDDVLDEIGRGVGGTEIKVLTLAVKLVLDGNTQSRRKRLEDEVPQIGADELAGFICNLLYGNHEKLEDIRLRLSDLDWVGRVLMSWLDLPLWYFALAEKWNAKVIEHILAKISGLMKEINCDFWEQNRSWLCRDESASLQDNDNSSPKKTAADVKWVLDQIREMYSAAGWDSVELRILSLAEEIAFEVNVRSRRKIIERGVAGMGGDVVAGFICNLLYGNDGRLEEVKSKLSDFDWLGQVMMGWLGLPLWYFAQVGRPKEKYVEQMLKRIPELVKEINPVFWAENRSWLCQSEPKK